MSSSSMGNGLESQCLYCLTAVIKHPKQKQREWRICSFASWFQGAEESWPQELEVTGHMAPTVKCREAWQRAREAQLAFSISSSPGSLPRGLICPQLRWGSHGINVA